MKTAQTIDVIGAGTMGADIAQGCVVAGLSVVMTDVERNASCVPATPWLGPLALCDLNGLDVVLAVMKVFRHDFDDPKYRRAPLLEEMAAAGNLGRKASRGFYSYERAN